MSLTYEPSYDGPIDKALLRYFGEWQRREKAHLRHIRSIEGRSEFCRQYRESRVCAGRIAVLRDCIRQIHWLRAVKNGTSPE